jgi:hypothetical protein
MNFFLALLVWLVISALLGLGIFMATVKGIYWLLIAFIIVFLLAVWRIGCKTH